MIDPGEDKAAIRSLQIAYGRMFDARDADGYAALFSEDAEITQHDGRTFPGHEARKAVLNMPPPNGAFHHMLDAEIAVDGYEAEGRCDFFARTNDGRFALGHYQDRYVRASSGWKIKSRSVNINRWVTDEDAAILMMRHRIAAR